MRLNKYSLKNINILNKENNYIQAYLRSPDSLQQENLIEKKPSSNGVNGSNGLKNIDLIESQPTNQLQQKFINQENTDFVVKISMAVLYQSLE